MAAVTKEQMKELIRNEQIARFTLYRDKLEEADSGKMAWAVWAYTWKDNEAHVMVAGRGPSNGKTRHYTSLDRAYEAIREMGFKIGMIEIDG